MYIISKYFLHHHFVSFHSLTIMWGKNRDEKTLVTYIGENAGNLGIISHYCFVHMREQDSNN